MFHDHRSNIILGSFLKVDYGLGALLCVLHDSDISTPKRTKSEM